MRDLNELAAVVAKMRELGIRVLHDGDFHVELGDGVGTASEPKPVSPGEIAARRASEREFAHQRLFAASSHRPRLSDPNG